MPRGRPKTKIDKDQVRALAEIQCSWAEIASVLKTSRQVLQKRFNRVVEEGWLSGRMSLRREQMKAAMAGNVVMMIWLGKQYLGQADKLESNNVNIDIEQCDDAALLSRGRELFAGTGAEVFGAVLRLPAFTSCADEVCPMPIKDSSDFRRKCIGKISGGGIQDGGLCVEPQAPPQELPVLDHQQELRNGGGGGVDGET